MVRLYVLVAALSLCACGNNSQKEKNLDSEKEVFQKVAQKEPVKVYNRYWNDLARYLGGLEPTPGSLLDSVEYRPEAQQHRAFFNAAWAQKKTQFIDKLSGWADKTLPKEHKNNENVFYPFSGADFLTINTLYPDAKQYVLFGLEREGDIPHDLKTNVSKDRLATNLRNLQISIDDIMHLSYFKTIDMNADFNRYELNGTLPVLLAFMARTGNAVLDIQPVHITSDGKIAFSAEKNKQIAEDTLVSGVQILFRKDENGPEQSLCYFSVNVSDVYLTHCNGFKKYFQSYKPTYTYIKSASYLMHNDYFSQVRSLILETSKFLLQDDSGIALRYFDRNVWDLKFYGAYSRPIPLFGNRYQPEMFKIYASDSSIKKLDFGIGYNNFVGTSNLMGAWRKDAYSTTASTAQTGKVN